MALGPLAQRSAWTEKERVDGRVRAGRQAGHRLFSFSLVPPPPPPPTCIVPVLLGQLELYVIHLSPLLVRQRPVRLVEQNAHVVPVRSVDVGVALLLQAVVALFDLGGGRAPRHVQQLVKVDGALDMGFGRLELGAELGAGQGKERKRKEKKTRVGGTKAEIVAIDRPTTQCIPPCLA